MCTNSYIYIDIIKIVLEYFIEKQQFVFPFEEFCYSFSFAYTIYGCVYKNSMEMQWRC